MKPASVVLFAILFGAIPLSGQNGTAGMENMGQTQNFIVKLPQGPSTCPVSLRAQQAASGNMLAVRSGEPKGPAQGLHLILTNRDSRQIVGATVTVRGLTAKGRVTRALSDPALTGLDDDAARTLEVTFSAGTSREFFTDFSVPGLTSVRAIDLDSVTYADGSTWKLAPGKTCRAVPDPLMLIVSR
ncbi:MAG: hypothetical protein ABSE87_08340 [Terracidiphilus sp.]|jgi:hypothetical protein